MSYQVLVEKVPDGIFSATVIGLSDCVAEGLTKEEALENANMKLEIHGSLRDDQTFEDFVSEMHYSQPS